MAKIRLRNNEWKDGRITVYGTKHTIHVEAIGIGGVSFIYELSPGKYRFLGVERYLNDPNSEFAGDLPPIVQHMDSSAVTKPVWVRLYKEDKQRRSYFD